MKKILLVCAALAMLAGTAQAKGVGLAWNGCMGTSFATNTTQFDCDPFAGSIYSLFTNMSLDAQLSGIVALDGIMDLAFNGQTDVPQFWHYEQGGCNAAGIVLQKGRNTTVCGSPNSSALCGTGGSACDGVITAYGLNYGGPNRARLLFTMARASVNPTTLPAAPTLVFVCSLDFFMDNAATCAGCATPTSIAFNWATLYTIGGVAGAVSSTDPGSVQPSVCVNATTCDVVPVKNKTWGALKALYR